MIAWILAGMLASFLAWAGDTRAAEAFVVGPGDRLSVTVHRRADLSGEFRVLPGGALSLPFVGNITVAGRSVDQIRAALTQRLREDASLLDPRVSVEIAEMQQILVAGAVRRPGQYPFQLGMTVSHALAAAGGVRRFELEEVGARIEIVRLRERLRQSQDSLGIALVRQARLLAEAADKEEFDAPAAAARYIPADRLQQALDAERNILRRRAAAHSSLIAMLASQTGAYNDEIRALSEQEGSKGQESELLTQESKYVENLMRQGLSPRTSRVSELARSVVQVEGERRQIQAFMARAQQEIARLGQTRMNAINARQLEIATGLKDVDDTMANLRVTVAELRAGLGELREALPTDEGPIGPRGPATISILRVRLAPPQRIAAQADTELMPGDLVDASDDAGAGRLLAAGAGR